MQLKGSKAE